jgi:hypothetical protein
MKLLSCVVAAAFLAAPAAAEEAQTSPSAFAQVMRAQYAAKQAPLPANADEAQRIYDAYLRSIGKPIEKPSQNSGDSAGIPSH